MNPQTTASPQLAALSPQAAAPAPQAAASAPPAMAPNGAPLNLSAVAPQGATPSVSVQQPAQFDTKGMTDALAKYYQIPSTTQGIVGQQQANAYNAQTGYENSVAQKQLQVQRDQERLDSSKYNIQNTKDGVKILDPLGNQVSVGEYASLTGANPADALKGSTNPQDQQFVQDYNNYEQFLNAAMQKSTSKEAAQVYQGFVTANPSLANMTPQQASSAFLSQYGSYFGQQQSGQTPASGQYTPQYSPSIENYVAEKALFGIPTVGSAGASGLSGNGASLFSQAAQSATGQ